MTVEGVTIASVNIARLDEDVIGSEGSGDHVTVKGKTKEVHLKSEGSGVVQV